MQNLQNQQFFPEKYPGFYVKITNFRYFFPKHGRLDLYSFSCFFNFLPKNLSILPFFQNIGAPHRGGQTRVGRQSPFGGGEVTRRRAVEVAVGAFDIHAARAAAVASALGRRADTRNSHRRHVAAVRNAYLYIGKIFERARRLRNTLFAAPRETRNRNAPQALRAAVSAMPAARPVGSPRRIRSRTQGLRHRPLPSTPPRRG